MNTIILLAMISLPCAVIAQTAPRSVVSSAGESSVSANYKMDWTLGEIATETGSTQARLYTQGFNQPHISIKKTGEANPGEISVVPNPVQEKLNIVFNSINNTKVLIAIIDEQGRQVLAQQSTIANGRISLALVNYSRGVYFLSVKDMSGAILGTFTIVKN